MNQFFIKITLSLLLLAIFLFQMDMQALGNISEQISGLAWIGALLFMALQILILSWRWLLFVNLSGKKINYKTSLKITLASLLANFVFITSITGVFVRIALTVQHGMALLKCSCAAVIDRIMTLFALVILAVVFMPFTNNILGKTLSHPFLMTASLSVILAVLIMPFFSKELIRQYVLPNRKLASIILYLRALIAKPRKLITILTVSICAQFCYFAAVHQIGIASGASLSFLQLLSVLPLITLVASLPISFGGWGVREGAFVYGLGLLGVSMETAFIISVQIGLISLLSTLLMSLPALFISDLNELIKNPKNRKPVFTQS